MSKDEIKLLCEEDNKLQWWAMVLFAEISELVTSQYDMDVAVYKVIKAKVEEFPRLVIMNAVNKVKDKINKAEDYDVK